MVSNKSGRQWVARDTPDSLPNASLGALLPNIPEIPYHDDFWKVLVDVARSYTPNPQHSQDVPLSLPLSLPLATMPGYDTSNAIQPYSMQPEAQLQPSLAFSPFSDVSLDYFDVLGPQLDAMSCQGQAFGESFDSFTEDHGMPPYEELWNLSPHWQ